MLVVGHVIEGDQVLGGHGLRCRQGIGGRLVVGARRGRSHAVRVALLGGGLGPFQDPLHLDLVLLVRQGAAVGVRVLVVVVDQALQAVLQIRL